MAVVSLVHIIICVLPSGAAKWRRRPSLRVAGGNRHLFGLCYSFLPSLSLLLLLPTSPPFPFSLSLSLPPAPQSFLKNKWAVVYFLFVVGSERGSSRGAGSQVCGVCLCGMWCVGRGVWGVCVYGVCGGYGVYCRCVGCGVWVGTGCVGGYGVYCRCVGCVGCGWVNGHICVCVLPVLVCPFLGSTFHTKHSHTLHRVFLFVLYPSCIHL